MKEKIRNAFDKIEADEELKAKTRHFLTTELEQRSSQHFFRIPRYLPAAVCFLFILFAGGHVIMTPAATISIDINPSIELDINRFDQVIRTTPYNEDGSSLTESLNLTFKNYNDAIEEILQSSQVEALLSDDELLSITVVGNENTQCQKILSDMEQQTESRANSTCRFASSSEVAKAHESGLSYGKYKAYLELNELLPDITVQNIQGMTMREIQELIETASGSGAEGTSLNNFRSSDSHNRQNAQSHGSGQGQGNGQKKHKLQSP